MARYGAFRRTKKPATPMKEAPSDTAPYMISLACRARRAPSIVMKARIRNAMSDGIASSLGMGRIS